ncbi:OprO/OprP family phosphate-selective porin [Oleisolibacter albus]|uniref:OprO/OprP family phosphate-selective porin n=1 Tax=Oleisolibacter albus TaxID=2171757 RepID=UPI000DF327B6|nr:porin [Oleisolibacter albus]
MRRYLLLAGCALPLACLVSPVLAQSTSSSTELERLVRAQAEEIANLRARLDTVEGKVAKPAPAPAKSAGSADIKAVWGEGAPTLTSEDGSWSFKPRGRVLVDVNNTSGSRYDARNLTTTGTRALRLGAEGEIGAHFFYQFEADFADNEIDVVAAYLGWRGKMGDLGYDARVGNLFNDRSVDGSTSSDATPFLERNVVATAIIPQRGFFGVGTMGRLFGKGWHVSVSATGNDVDGDHSQSDAFVLMARGHWNPVVTQTAALHLGLWAFEEDLPDSAHLAVTRNTAIGGRFNSNLRIGSGPLLDAAGSLGYGAELGGYAGPVWAMAEAGQREVRLSAQPDATYDAASLSAGWFVTGEKPPLSTRTGAFGKPKVKASVLDGGIGAWELTARYEHLDFGDAASRGDGWAATAGVNWYLNDFIRLMLNGILWETDNRVGSFVGKDDGQTVTARAQISF